MFSPKIQGILNLEHTKKSRQRAHTYALYGSPVECYLYILKIVFSRGAWNMLNVEYYMLMSVLGE